MDQISFPFADLGNKKTGYLFLQYNGEEGIGAVGKKWEEQMNHQPSALSESSWKTGFDTCESVVPLELWAHGSTL